MRVGVLLLATALVAALCGAVVVGSSVAGSPAGETEPPPDQLVTPVGERDSVWPYTSRRRSVTGRTLALNVVVRGDSQRVRRLLTDRTDTNWSTTERNATVVASPWRPAHGSTRYTYVTPGRNATGRWVEPDYQLAVGTYFGQRTHVRAYDGPSGNWTAMQAHTEYWDWFRLRHTVTGVAVGARFVERDLRGTPPVEDISRIEHGHTGGGSDGRWTLVDLLPAVLVGGVAVPLATRRRAGRDLLLPVALLALVLGVRAWGLATGAVFPRVTPKPFAAVGYLALAAGPPALVAVLARDRPVRRTVPLAVAGLGVGVTVDLALVGVHTVPQPVALHRVTLVAAIGLLAVGGSRQDRRIVGAGVGAWLLALAAPLFGVV